MGEKANSDLAYQTRALQRVSRTFALTIPQLPDALRDVAGNAYLLCRIADTIEDEPALAIQQKLQFVSRFVDVVENRGDAVAFGEELAASLSSATSASERDLVVNTPTIVRVTNGFSDGQRRIVGRGIRVMARGMSEFQQIDTSAGLKDLHQLDRYCYVVAGVVGEMLTELFCDYSEQIEERRHELLPLAVSFGQGLQMTNILKDVWEDLDRGACWLPRDIFLEAGFNLRALHTARDGVAFGKGVVELVAIAREHLAEALRFVQLIPAREPGIRRHCIWALGMAVLTLRRIHATPTFRNGWEVKISRRSVRGVRILGSCAARSNLALEALFNALVSDLPVPRSERHPKRLRKPPRGGEVGADGPTRQRRHATGGMGGGGGT